MSSSNLAVRMEHAATDLLSLPPFPALRIVGNEQTAQAARPRISLTNRKLLRRDQGLRYFRVR